MTAWEYDHFDDSYDGIGEPITTPDGITYTIVVEPDDQVGGYAPADEKA